jgi:hypothetical protein
LEKSEEGLNDLEELKCCDLENINEELNCCEFEKTKEELNI